MVTLPDVQAALGRIRDRIYLSPCARTETLSRLSGTSAFLKLENLQMTGSYKERGALNTLLLAAEAERARGLIAASAGNHAQGVAYHAGRLGVKATIVMPESTPIMKVANTRAHGARIVLHGANYDEAYAEARRLEQAEGLTFVHPFDDPRIIAGQGTVGLEILDQVPEVDAILVPIGGGGLASGVAVAAKALRPEVRIVGVETEVLPSMLAAIEAGRPVTLEPASTVADGIAVKRAGDLTFEHVRRLVDEIVTVSEEEIASAILYLLEKEKTVAEGAGAVTVAALMNRRATGLEGRRVVGIVSGGNIDVNLVARIIERGLVKDGRLVRVSVALTDKPGQLAKVSAIIAHHRANVIEVHHTRAFATRFGDTTLQLTLETRGLEHVQELLQALRERGYQVQQLGM
ncbi:threonine dehydratase [Anaeromyxobacter dehalogenans 2CP-1]|uniref:Threonine dehydratase n=1 Tax=Anaeromyxobacter dehalogenans (strain ATCC BAA-258 / DSM 21875 / 2CP-1) TaxID=455488 RepID=B8J632_ANAD2|nr:threonine ammonia-lyase [Anaeromyxobacter dehalogenans]ACL66927.1 threonine dehydratase [Anaeromyxobacter dehalogenans 2CP-1]